MKYLQPLVKIPSLGPDPPSFLLLGQLIELELAKQVRVSDINVEDSIGSLVEPAEVVETTPTSSLTKQASSSSSASAFDSQFNTESFDFSIPRSPVKEKNDERSEFNCFLRYYESLSLFVK